ncbi:MAG: hypothetical protein IKD47_05140 [Clostridia bacterium]|nr:hypothetical protein [Clostridia bacterium]
MANVKKQLKKFGRQVWELYKSSLMPAFMYLCAGMILMSITMKGDKVGEIQWDNSKLLWTIVCSVGAAAYNALVMWANGGQQYEMLVSGNMKRMSAQYGEGYKISTHKEWKEYRPWKGFVIGALIGIYALITALYFGLNQDWIDSSLGGSEHGVAGSTYGVLVVIGILISGWTILPFLYINMGGVHVSYFLSALFVLLPIIVSGVFYIAGAYARRNKALRQQMIAEQQAKATAEKEKKINYGGLPGTKPKKRK